MPSNFHVTLVEILDIAKMQYIFTLTWIAFFLFTDTTEDRAKEKAREEVIYLVHEVSAQRALAQKIQENWILLTVSLIFCRTITSKGCSSLKEK